jgi:ribonuclease G
VSKELVVSVGKNEDRIALLEDKQLIELNKEARSLQFTVGNIYLARVRRIMPGLNAAFVNVGYERDAFLHYLDLGPQFSSLFKYVDLAKKGKAPAFQKFRCQPDIDKHGKIGDVLKVGQSVLVQVVKEPISKKGPRLTSEISIAGRNLVLLPFSDRVSVSSKIKTNEEKNRLRQLIKSIKPPNYGVIVRTAAEGTKVAELDKELKQLTGKWEKMLANLKSSKLPALVISELGRLSTIVRDSLTGDFNNIYVDNEDVYKEIREYILEIAPEKKKIVKHYSNKTGIFESFGINKQIKTLFGRMIPFNSGSYLIIEHTEALHVIDVNSGNRTQTGANQDTNAFETNLKAAKEIARQLRLRDMGGIIVVDFIDMQSNDNKNKLFEKMKEFMEEDNTKHNILPLTRFGLMQITRQRIRPETNIKTIEKCPSCKGTGEITPSLLFVDELENELVAFMQKSGLKKFTIKVHPFIYAFVTKGVFKSVKKDWEKLYKCKVRLLENSSFTLFEHEFLTWEGDPPEEEYLDIEQIEKFSDKDEN